MVVVEIHPMGVTPRVPRRRWHAERHQSTLQPVQPVVCFWVFSSPSLGQLALTRPIASNYVASLHRTSLLDVSTTQGHHRGFLPPQ